MKHFKIGIFCLTLIAYCTVGTVSGHTMVKEEPTVCQKVVNPVVFPAAEYFTVVNSQGVAEQFTYTITPAIIDAAASPMGGAKFKTVTITGDSVARINAYGTDDQNYYSTCADSFRIYLSNIKDGGNYRYLIKKTVSGVCLVYCTAMTVIGGGTTISLSGSTNTYFWINFTKVGTTTIIQKE